MATSLRLRHLRHYKDIVRLLYKYGRGSVLSRGAIDAMREDIDDAGGEPTAPPAAEELAADLERLGPTFIKLGQVLSTRADLLPVAYLTALSRLQDKVEPFPYEEVQRIVESELGARLSKVFSTFDPKPLAAASLGQVHRAALRDGREVAVKVQRPDIREGIAEDLAALAEVAQLLDSHTEVGRRIRFAAVVEEFERTLTQELDYRLEAQNLITLGQNLAKFERIVVPQPIGDLSTAKVLTMGFVAGRKITEIGPLARLDMDGPAIAEQLFRAYLQQILVDGFFHADPHPGNVFLTSTQDLALIDLGMVGRLSPETRAQLLKLVLGVSEGRGDDVARVAEAISEKDHDFDPVALRRVIASLVAQQQGAQLKDLAVGRIVLEVVRAAMDTGARLPSELTLLGKTLLQLDEIGRCLAPDFDPNQAIRDYAGELMSQQLRQSMSPGNLLSTFTELREFVQQVPARANKLLDKVVNDELTFSVKTIDETLLLGGLQKIANRITLGLILAALIVGAALLMRVPTSFQLAGYPGFAILCFVAAASGGVWLAASILLQDRRDRRSQKVTMR
jgi:ubiquinone biosynthesis protein